MVCGRSNQKLTVCFRDGFPRFNDRLGDVGSTVYGPVSLFEKLTLEIITACLWMCGAFASYYTAL